MGKLDPKHDVSPPKKSHDQYFQAITPLNSGSTEGFARGHGVPPHTAHLHGTDQVAELVLDGVVARHLHSQKVLHLPTKGPLQSHTSPTAIPRCIDARRWTMFETLPQV